MLPQATVKNIAKQERNMMIGEDATRMLSDAAEERIKEITSKAAEFARHAGREATIKAADVKMALKY